MPSWSWAATDNSKTWPQEYIDTWATTSVRGAQELPEQQLITPSGNLQIRGHLSTFQSMPSYVKDKFTARDLALGLFSIQFVRDSWVSTREDFKILTQDTNDGYDKAVLGLAQFDDDDRPTMYTHACLLLKEMDRYEEPYGRLQGKRCVKLEFIVSFAAD